MQTKILKKNWKLDSDAFQRLLEWLDNGENSDGERYLEIRSRLVAYFDRKNSLNPDELADETLNRVARRLSEEKIDAETPAKFCYITAKFVFLESLRNHAKDFAELDENVIHKQSNVNFENSDKEKRLDCLENCLENLESANREIILGYYFGEERIKIENRRELAKKYDISSNALTIRACRIREKLQNCMEKCVKCD